jgi:hypothetical protein
VLPFVQAGLLSGRSIGFLPTKARHAEAKEAERRGWPAGTLVIDEWLLLEDAVCTLPCNPEAVTGAVSKSMDAVGPEALRKLLPAEMLTGVERTRLPVPFAALSEAERAVRGAIEAVDFRRIAERAIETALARHQGRVGNGLAQMPGPPSGLCAPESAPAAPVC